MKNILITGSLGLVGFETALFFGEKGLHIVGVDNDMRSCLFGKEVSVWKKKHILERNLKYYKHVAADIRDITIMEELFKKYKFSVIIHTAAQPSHDWAANNPLIDFSINAWATAQLLWLYKKYCPAAVFIFTSTNKVYGDLPNKLPLKEFDTRFDLTNTHSLFDGIDDSLSIDRSTHSLFGASKLSADILVQEYGRYFGLRTGVFRLGCVTGGAHTGAEQHGFLSYLVKTLIGGSKYTVYGYKGKQVRDNIHARDLASAFWEYSNSPKCGEVYNLGGGRERAISVKEAIQMVESKVGKRSNIEFISIPRKGDHKWYITSNKKFHKDYSSWHLEFSLNDIFDELINQYNTNM